MKSKGEVIVLEEDVLNLLDNQNRLILDMVSLISKNKRWYTVSEIGASLNVVERTVQRYIHQLEDTIAQFNASQRIQNQTIDITYEKYKGVYLTLNKGSNYAEFKDFVLENDLTLTILKQVMFEEFKSIKKYAIDYYVSESAIRKSLKKIERFLDLYQLSLSKKEFQVLGEEKRIRLVMYILGWTIYRGKSWPFHMIDENKILTTVDHFSEQVGLSYSVIQRKQFANFLGVIVFRVRKKHYVTYEENWKDYVDLDVLRSELTIVDHFMKEYNIPMEAEIYYMVLLLQTKLKTYESQSVSEKIIARHKTNHSDVYQATQSFIKEFEECFISIPEELEERFFITSFCAHLYGRLFPNMYVDVDGYQVLGERNAYYPTLQHKMIDFLDKLYEQTQFDLFLEDGFLLPKYMLLFSSIVPVTYYEPTIRMCLDSDLPYLVKRNMKERIRDRYKYDFNLQFVELSEAVTADIVLTNIPNTMEEELRDTHKVHLFDFPIKLRDFTEIERKLMSISQEMTEAPI